MGDFRKIAKPARLAPTLGRMSACTLGIPQRRLRLFLISSPDHALTVGTQPPSVVIPANHWAIGKFVRGDGGTISGLSLARSTLRRVAAPLPPFYIYYPAQNKRVECLRLFVAALRSHRKRSSHRTGSG